MTFLQQVAARFRRVKLDQFIPSYVMGAGAFTDLAIATHRPTKRMLAIKCIDKSAALAMPEVIVRVVSEREILAHIKHDNIVELGFVWQDSTRVYIGVDYMCGGTLQYHIKSSHDFKLREQAIRIWFAEVASALHYLHQNSIVHRDVKPENIVLDKRGHAYLTGFGLAERVTGTFLTDVVGSESYMAPELLQLRDENAMVPGYNYCVDWFALGVTLCELLTQKHPFRPASASKKKSLGTWKDHFRHCRVSELRTFGRGCSLIAESNPSDAYEVVQGLIQLSPTSRLGQYSVTHIDDIRSHMWLSWWTPGMNLKAQAVDFIFNPRRLNYDVKEYRDVGNWLRGEHPSAAAGEPTGCVEPSQSMEDSVDRLFAQQKRRVKRKQLRALKENFAKLKSYDFRTRKRGSFKAAAIPCPLSVANLASMSLSELEVPNQLPVLHRGALPESAVSPSSPPPPAPPPKPPRPFSSTLSLPSINDPITYPSAQLIGRPIAGPSRFKDIPSGVDDDNESMLIKADYGRFPFKSKQKRASIPFPLDYSRAAQDVELASRGPSRGPSLRRTPRGSSISRGFEAERRVPAESEVSVQSSVTGVHAASDCVNPAVGVHPADARPRQQDRTIIVASMASVGTNETATSYGSVLQSFPIEQARRVESDSDMDDSSRVEAAQRVPVDGTQANASAVALTDAENSAIATDIRSTVSEPDSTDVNVRIHDLMSKGELTTVMDALANNQKRIVRKVIQGKGLAPVDWLDRATAKVAATALAAAVKEQGNEDVNGESLTTPTASNANRDTTHSTAPRALEVGRPTNPTPPSSQSAAGLASALLRTESRSSVATRAIPRSTVHVHEPGALLVKRSWSLFNSGSKSSDVRRTASAREGNSSRMKVDKKKISHPVEITSSDIARSASVVASSSAQPAVLGASSKFVNGAGAAHAISDAVNDRSRRPSVLQPRASIRRADGRERNRSDPDAGTSSLRRDAQGTSSRRYPQKARH